MVSKLKLHSLDYPRDEPLPDPRDPSQFRSLVLWLEATYLRAYPQSERDFLGPTAPAKNFDKEMPKYLAELKSPLRYSKDDAGMNLELAEWLIDEAINRAYEESGAASITGSVVEEEKMEEAKRQELVEGLNHAISMNNAEFKQALGEVGKMLGMAPHPDPLTMLRAIDKALTHMVTQKEMEQDETMMAGSSKNEGQKKEASTTQKHQKPFSLADIDLGVYSSGSAKVDNAVKVLRLIHVAQLRQLQTRVNELLVGIQKLTADPKTDMKLGRVGR